MANILAAQSGNWSATATWVGGVVPTGADNAYANGYTVTVNVDAAAAKISTVAENGAAGGGVFNLSAGVTLTAYCEAGTTTVVSSGSGSASIVGSVSGGSGSSALGAYNNSSGTLTITGTATGGSGTYAHGVFNNSSGTLTVTGNVTGGSGSSALGAYNNSSGTLTITGTATGGSGTYAHGALNNSSGTLTITGTATGGSGDNAFGAYNNSAGLMSVKRAKGNAFGLGSVGLASVSGVFGSQTGLTFVEEIEYGMRGQAPISGNAFISPVSTNTAIFSKQDFSQIALIRADNAATYGSPAASDVRHGVSYAVGNLVGTAYIPNPASVSLGVPVDATVGTAYLTATDITTALSGLLGPAVVAAVADGFAASTLPEDVAAIEARLSEQVLTGPVLVVPAPASSGEMIAWCRCWDEHGVLEEGVLIEVQLVGVPRGTGDAYDMTLSSATSDAGGLASLSIPRGAGFKFRARRNGGTWKSFSGADAESIELPDFLGP